MSNRLIEELHKENLCTHFILPLLKMNKFSFVSFVNSYLTRSKEIVVKLIDPTFCSRRLYERSEYGGTYFHDGFYYLVYKIPLKWYPDVEKFIEGKYSQFSSAAKEAIQVFSGLQYKDKTPTGRIVTDARILALNKSPSLRDAWGREFWDDVYDSCLDDDDELLSKHTPEEIFIDLSVFAHIKEQPV